MNFSQKLNTMDPLFHMTGEGAHQIQQQQQQQQGNHNQQQTHFTNVTLVQNNPRMVAAQSPSSSSSLNIMSTYDRVPFPVVHSLMNPINDQ